MYMRRANNKKSLKFEKELKIIEELKKRLTAGDGWTRIRMKVDGQELDITETADNKFLVTFPPYYDATKREAPYKALEKWFAGLDDITEFILAEGWRNRW